MIVVTRAGVARMSSRSAICAITSLYSPMILSCSSPVRRCRRICRISPAWSSDSRYRPSACMPKLRRRPSGRKASRPPGVSPSARDEHLAHQRRIPALAHQRRLGHRRRRRALDGLDELVDVGQRDRQAFEHVAAFARLAQLEHGAPRDHLAAVLEEDRRSAPSGCTAWAGRRSAPPCSCRRCPAAASACTGCSAPPRALRRA